MIEEASIVTMALGLAIGHYSIYYLVFEKSFIERFRKFREALTGQLKRGAEEFLNDFKRELKEKSDPAELVEFTQKWAVRQSVLLDVLKTWTSLTNHHRWIIISCFLSVVSTGAYLLSHGPLNPGAERLVTFLGIAALFLFVEICVFLSFLWNFSRLSAKVARFELGEPLEKTFEEEIRRALKERESE